MIMRFLRYPEHAPFAVGYIGGAAWCFVAYCLGAQCEPMPRWFGLALGFLFLAGSAAHLWPIVRAEVRRARIVRSGARTYALQYSLEQDSGDFFLSVASSLGGFLGFKTLRITYWFHVDGHDTIRGEETVVVRKQGTNLPERWEVLYDPECPQENCLTWSFPSDT